VIIVAYTKERTIAAVVDRVREVPCLRGGGGEGEVPLGPEWRNGRRSGLADAQFRPADEGLHCACT
jgi:hypothetical protein